MAQSRNQLQVRRWGSRFGVRNGALTPAPAASLDYWIRANEAAIEQGKALPQGTFFLLSYDAICANPREEVTRFVRFLDLDPPESVLRELVAIPQSAITRPRAELDPETVFGHDRLTRVRALGYAVEQ